MLDDAELADFRERLRRREEELQRVADTGEEAAKTVELDQTRQGRLSRMDALQGQAMSQEAQRRRGLERRRIAAALARMEQGEYGLCLECGEPIATARLALDPSVSLCIACARAADESDAR